MKILLADDDDRIRTMLRVWLEEGGFEVFEAENGKRAVAVQQTTPVDLLICDLIMPVQEGIETIRRSTCPAQETGILPRQARPESN